MYRTFLSAASARPALLSACAWAAAVGADLLWVFEPLHALQGAVLYGGAGALSYWLLRGRYRSGERERHELEQRYRALFDLNPDPVYALDVRGRFVTRNAAARIASRLSCAEFRRTSLEQVLLPDDAPAAEAAFARALRGEVVRVELAGLAPDGHRRRDVLGVPIVCDGRVTGVFAIAKDITAQVEAERLLRQSEQRYRALIEGNPDSVYTIDPSGRFMTLNAGSVTLTGYRRSELVGRHFQELLLPDELPWVQQRFERCLDGQHEYFRCYVRRRDGGGFHASVSLSPYAVDGELLGVVGISRDVSAQVMAERELAQSREELRRLTEALQGTLESERRKLARDLHDELGQCLTGLKLDLDWVRYHRNDPDAPLAEKLEQMGRALEDTVEAVRRLTRRLRPMLLDELGLIAACDWLVQDFSGRTGIECALNAGADELPLSERAATAAYRVVQEALTNIARHSQATRVDIHLWADSSKLSILIGDDGVGMTQPDSGRLGLGLLGMRERVQALGGRLVIDSAPGEGVRLRVDLPAERVLAEEQHD